MPDPYTYIAKPTGSSYTYVNFEGKQTYDQAELTYDDPNVFYDSYNPNVWTDVTKPVGTISYVGIASGLLMPLTFRSQIVSSPWTNISKPN